MLAVAGEVETGKTLNGVRWRIMAKIKSDELFLPFGALWRHPLFRFDYATTISIPLDKINSK